MTRVKVCGITNMQDALKAVAFGAWAIGFVFYKKSPRFIGAFKAKKIIDSLPPFVTPVGVFVNQKEGAVKDITEFCGFKVLQFHGDEKPDYFRRFDKYKIIKAFRVSEKPDFNVLRQFNVSAFLFDSHSDESFGGTGKTFDWSVIKEVKNLNRPVILSGGLNSGNVRLAIETVKPYAVDVSSGVEQAPGQKDERLMKEFLDTVSFSNRE